MTEEHMTEGFRAAVDQAIPDITPECAIVAAYYLKLRSAGMPEDLSASGALNFAALTKNMVADKVRFEYEQKLIQTRLQADMMEHTLGFGGHNKPGNNTPSYPTVEITPDGMNMSPDFVTFLQGRGITIESFVTFVKNGGTNPGD